MLLITLKYVRSNLVQKIESCFNNLFLDFLLSCKDYNCLKRAIKGGKIFFHLLKLKLIKMTGSINTNIPSYQNSNRSNFIISRAKTLPIESGVYKRKSTENQREKTVESLESPRSKRQSAREQILRFNYGDASMKHKYWNFIPRELYEKILFHTYIAQFYSKQKPSQIDMYKFSYHSGFEPLDFVRKSMFDEEFEFLQLIDNNFISINSIHLNSDTWVYKQISYNFNKIFLKNLINSYICEKDKKFCVVMGGYFSKYQTDSYFSERFPWLFKQIAKKADVDIYIFHASILHYQRKFRNMGIEIISRSYLPRISYIINNTFFASMKLKIKSQIINIIFLNEKYDNKSIENSCINMLDRFDLDICKIFYSYFYDTVFVNVNLLTKYIKITSKCSVKPIIKDLSKYKADIEKIEFFRDNSLLKLRLALNRENYTIILRYLKYCFKNFYIDENEASEHIETIKKLDCFFKEFPSYIIGETPVYF